MRIYTKANVWEGWAKPLGRRPNPPHEALTYRPPYRRLYMCNASPNLAYKPTNWSLSIHYYPSFCCSPTPQVARCARCPCAPARVQPRVPLSMRARPVVQPSCAPPGRSAFVRPARSFNLRAPPPGRSAFVRARPVVRPSCAPARRFARTRPSGLPPPDGPPKSSGACPGRLTVSCARRIVAKTSKALHVGSNELILFNC